MLALFLQRFRRSDRMRWLTLASAMLVFCGLVARCYVPGQGFTAMIAFGELMAPTRLPVLAEVNYHSMRNSWGYDGQYYAQLAVRPDLTDPALIAALDNPPYRSGRILFPATAHVLGLGRPAWVLRAYALLNVGCWFALAVLLLRWFPPDRWSHVGRWVGTLFCGGLLCSVRLALTDGPALLGVAVAMALLDARRPWLASVVFGATGLGKETALLATTALAWPEGRSWRAWGATIGRGVVALVPAALWLAWVIHCTGVQSGDSAGRAFSLPGVELWHKLRTTAAGLQAADGAAKYALHSLALVVALIVQGLFFALRPRWRDPWWRLGAIHTVLLLVLGWPVWEGDPGAAARVMLPLQLAFNVAVPSGRRWLAVLLLGNATIFSASFVFPPAERPEPLLRAPAALLAGGDRSRMLSAALDAQWLPLGKSWWDSWRWTTGDAEIAIRNPHPFPLAARVTFRASSRSPRQLKVLTHDVVRWQATLGPTPLPADIPRMHFRPGETRIRFAVDPPVEAPAPPDKPRQLVCRIYDLLIDFEEPTPAPP